MIPVSEPAIGERELEYVTECLRSGWISSAGRYIEAFESQWSAYCGKKHGIAVTNGTAALEAAVECLRLEPGDEVILPAFTIISCALAVVRSGGVPVLVDSDPITWCMDTAQVASRITRRTRAIMPVHIYGHPVDMDPVIDLAERHGLAIIEDAAEAHGAQYLSRRGTPEARWLRCGGMGHLSTFSFFANKLITTGEGGMVLAESEEHAAALRSLRNLCFRSDRRFYHTEAGHNLRLTNLQAALGLAQLERLDSIIEKKRSMARRYGEGLAGIAGLQLPSEAPWARSVYWMYGVVLDERHAMDAAELARRLRSEGVDTRPFFLGMHEQPVLLERGLFQSERHPVAERIARLGLYLPSGLTLTESQIDQVCLAVRSALR
jgi:perosamine synthetase